MAESVRGVSALQTELERAKESLKDVDENIKKLTGRDPTIQRTAQRRVSIGSEQTGRGVAAVRTPGGENRLFNLARRGIIQDGGPSPAAPRRGAFARLGPRPGGRPRGQRGHDSGDEDDLPNRPTLQSSVVATPKEERSRQSSIAEQSKDRKGQARNRRMFGLLLGTLQKFKDESEVTKEKEEQRVQIEKKLEEKFKQEKEEILQERRQLYNERRKKQLTIKLIEQKMEMVKNHENWEAETRKLENFIRTKAKPPIFYMPKSLLPETQNKLYDTKKVVDDIVEQRRKKLEEEIAEMMSQVEGDVKEEDHDGEGDVSMGEEEGDSEAEHSNDDTHPPRPSQASGKHGDDKENERRERHGSGKDDLLEERKRRDREREQRDRDRQEREMRKREREGEDKEAEGGKRDRSGVREKDHERGRDSERHRGEHRRDKSGDGESKSRERDHHRSGKGRTEKRGRDHSDERSHGHNSSKLKRRSKDGKAERKEKIWEPMEDEEEEEFVGSKGEGDTARGGSDIASKMLAMAGMAGLKREVVGDGEGDMGHGVKMASDRNGASRHAHTDDEDASVETGGKQQLDAEPDKVEED